jgi:uncharacterized membrane-anchored protein/uncharacterized protein YqgQ
VNKIRVIFFSIILIWASISLAFIVQDIYSGPERSIPGSTNSMNVTEINLPTNSNINYIFILQAILIIWIISSFLALIFYFKKSISTIINISLSILGVFLVIGFAFIISYLISFNYPKNSQPINFSASSLVGSIPIIVLLLVLILIFVYIGVKFIPVNIKKDEKVDLDQSIGKMILELRFSDDIRGAIMKVYYDLSNTLKKHGIIEENYLTPREFENISINKIKIESKPFETIVNLFEEARYSLHPLNESHRKMAIEALEKIKKDLGDLK